MHHFLIFLTLIAAFACAQEATVPEALMGEWRTPAPRYEDRYLRFTTSSLAFGIGDGQEVCHPIRKIEAAKEHSATVYTVHYMDSEGKESTLRLTYRFDAEETIQLNNRNEIWMKVKTGRVI
jgi:hypothetical protein